MKCVYLQDKSDDIDFLKRNCQKLKTFFVEKVSKLVEYISVY